MKGQNRDLYGLQILRSVAAFGVIAHHTFEMSKGSVSGGFSPEWITEFGASGVDLFFVISGFIMVYVSFPPGKNPDSPKDFLIKRCTRIFPLYWICSAAIIVISEIGLLRKKSINVYTILNSLMLLPGDKLIYVSWTLSYEIYFYIAFSICLGFGKMVSTSFSVTLLMICGIVFGSEIRNSTYASFVSSPIVLEFCFGIALALFFSADGKWKISPALGALGFVVIIVSPIFIPHPDFLSASRVIVWGLPATLIVAAFLRIGRPQSKVGRATALLGNASYATYLTHIFIMMAYGWVIKWTIVGVMSQIVFVHLVILTCIATGVITHMFLERPILELVRTIIKNRVGRRPLEAGSSPR